MAVALSTFSTNVWDTVYNHLQTGTYAISTNNIFGSYNDKLISDVGLPLVIIYKPLSDRRDMTVDGRMQKSEVSLLIEVYHKSSQDAKSLYDEIVNKLYTGRSVFSAVQLKKIRIEPAGDDSYTTGNNKRHIYGMELFFTYTGSS